MALTRFRLSLWAVLIAGAAGGCIVERGPDGEARSDDRADVGAAEGVARSNRDGDAGSYPDWIDRSEGPSLFEYVTRRASGLAGRPYRPPDRLITPEVADLGYAQLRALEFRAEAAIWRGQSPFEVQLFHPGGANDTPVRINVVADGVSRPLPFDSSLFRRGDELAGIDTSLPAEAGWAGFRLLFPMNDADRMDEVVSFLGASYFRLVGPDQVYGLSARGLAVNVGGPEGEEFPDFTEFWLRRPDLGANRITFFALLDGPSVAGAYRFELEPGRADGSGQGTVLLVEARLFARTDVTRLGIAPLTSMYLHGTFRPGGDDDFRPRVHDSEGLLMHTSRDEWIWRPLTNGAMHRSTSLRDRNPAGFGLVQRERRFESYLDLEAQYHRRPSAWVDVDGDWGVGGVSLFEIPTVSEFNDNIVAWWGPDEPFRTGEERRYRYRLVTFGSRLGNDDGAVPSGAGQTLAQVARTRIGWDALPGQADPPPRSRRRLVVDFEGGDLAELPEGSRVLASVSASAGTVSDLQVHALPGGGRRATFVLEPDGDRGADMRLFLTADDTVVTETWSYLWEPGDVR